MDSVMFDQDGLELRDGNFEMLALVLEQLNERGVDWDELIELSLLASAYAAQQGGTHPDEYMTIVRSIKVTEQGIYGDC
jgi:beta-lactamase class A